MKLLTVSLIKIIKGVDCRFIDHNTVLSVYFFGLVKWTSNFNPLFFNEHVSVSFQASA